MHLSHAQVTTGATSDDGAMKVFLGRLTRGAPPGEDGAWSLILIASRPSLLSSFLPSLLKSPYSQSYGFCSSCVRM